MKTPPRRAAPLSSSLSRSALSLEGAKRVREGNKEDVHIDGTSAYLHT